MIKRHHVQSMLHLYLSTKHLQYCNCFKSLNTFNINILLGRGIICIRIDFWIVFTNISYRGLDNMVRHFQCLFSHANKLTDAHKNLFLAHLCKSVYQKHRDLSFIHLAVINLLLRRRKKLDKTSTLPHFHTSNWQETTLM